MKKQHEKSPCCQGKWWRHGGRRRQCLSCGKTFTRWKKKSRHPKRRDSIQLIEEYLLGSRSSFEQQALRRGLNPSTFRARMRQTLKRWNVQTPWPDIPSGPLIAIADAMFVLIHGQPHTIYIILLRPVESSTAVIAGTSLIRGHEQLTPGWAELFADLPTDARQRILALVCDGNQALIGLAHYYRWKLQRCQFHLLHRLQNYASVGDSNRSNYWGEYIQQVVKEVLYTTDLERLKAALHEIQKICDQTSSRGIKKVLSGFLTQYQDYRTYLTYPELHLPRTSNSLESLNAQFKALLGRAHGFNSVSALRAWLEAFCKHRKTITCHGH